MASKFLLTVLETVVKEFENDLATDGEAANLAIKSVIDILESWITVPVIVSTTTTPAVNPVISE